LSSFVPICDAQYSIVLSGTLSNVSTTALKKAVRSMNPILNEDEILAYSNFAQYGPHRFCY